MISTLPKVQLSQESIVFTILAAYYNSQVDNLNYQPKFSSKISIQGAVKKHSGLLDWVFRRFGRLKKSPAEFDMFISTKLSRQSPFIQVVNGP